MLQKQCDKEVLMITFKKSLVDYAIEVLKERKKIEPMPFKDLWEGVNVKVENDVSPEDKPLVRKELDTLIGRFYTNLSLDGRTINVLNNRWELRENLKYDDIHVDINDAYSDDDYDDDEESEEEEESEDEDEEEKEGEEFDEKSHENEVDPDELIKG